MFKMATRLFGNPEPVAVADSLQLKEVAQGARDIGERAAKLGLQIASIDGAITDLAAANTEIGERLDTVIGAAGQNAQTNVEISAALGRTLEAARRARSVLDDDSGSISHSMSQAIDQMAVLGRDVEEVSAALQQFGTILDKVLKASEATHAISRATRLIAINAGVEAARVGEAGKGFASIAQSIKGLSDDVGRFSEESGSNVELLSRKLTEILTTVKRSSQSAKLAVDLSEGARNATEVLNHLTTTLGDNISVLTSEIDHLARPVELNAASTANVREHVSHLATLVRESHDALELTSQRSGEVLEISEEFVHFVVEAGFETPDKHYIAQCQQMARAIGQLFEAALRSGDITAEQLFDTNYRKVEGTNPQQFMTDFTLFTDRVLPAVQESFLASLPKGIFCAAVDRNCYLPTHNAVYSRPQTKDPVWNAANCRNRRIFDDRTGLAAVRNTKSFLLQTYRRDMGGGQYRLIKDISAPIMVEGRHWGAFRVGLRAD